MRRFTAKDLSRYLQDCDSPPLLLDVREPWEYEKCCLEGSELVPMRQILMVADELDPEKETVVICHHGIRSRQVAIYLEQQGFNNVINLEGGVQAWAQDVDPTMNKY
ncbi:hypothetical protein MNBD_GAMMA21-2930 [hydrothermal vent metagenome]|uniref:Rhodanese domain-containing protein n=1 Tax=hydrothermal vent metagenome TaxID=652676 RepID=A0A3B1AF36_9ZZZZ